MAVVRSIPTIQAHRRARWFALGLLAGAGMATMLASEIALFDEFRPDWRAQWREQRLFSRPTVYRVVQEGEKPVLHAMSNEANSCLLREVDLRTPKLTQLRWRWKVRTPLVGNTSERERHGDDFAARVVVVFETSVLPLRTRAINYVWAAHLPRETTFPSPYSSNVAMIVLQSGAEHAAGLWRSETRDVVADYRRFFGREPERISAVGLFVDTDNTKGVAEAWFSDFVLTSGDPQGRRE
jgi:hypothetical protein